jgi:ferredoxin
MSLSMRLEPLGVTLPVAEGQSLLEAALGAGIRLRSSCRNGTCRECIATLEAGAVRYRIDWPGLSADEKLQGCVLPCVALPVGDVVLRQPFQDADAPASSA